MSAEANPAARSVVDELEQASAIRRALGLPDDAEVTPHPSGVGWQARIDPSVAALALALDRKLGGVDAARADTFVEAAVAGKLLDDGDLTITSASVDRATAERLYGHIVGAFRDLIDRGVLK